MNIYYLIDHAQKVEEKRDKTKSKDVNRVWSLHGVSSKGKLDIRDKPRLKNDSSNKVTTKFPKARDDRCLTLSIKMEEVLAHQIRSRLVESVATNIMVIALLGRTISLCVSRVATRLGIA